MEINKSERKGSSVAPEVISKQVKSSADLKIMENKGISESSWFNQNRNDSGKFEFVQPCDPNALRIIFRGFWNEATMRAYQEALSQRALVVGGSTPVNRVLLDLLHCTIQSPAVLDSMEKVIERYAGQIKTYGMLLPHSALLRVQMKRLMLPHAVIYFESETDAMVWLAP